MLNMCNCRCMPCFSFCWKVNPACTCGLQWYLSLLWCTCAALNACHASHHVTIEGLLCSVRQPGLFSFASAISKVYPHAIQCVAGAGGFVANSGRQRSSNSVVVLQGKGIDIPCTGSAASDSQPNVKAAAYVPAAVMWDADAAYTHRHARNPRLEVTGRPASSHSQGARYRATIG